MSGHRFVEEVRKQLSWLSDARAYDVAIAISDASVALPLIGKHLEPLAMLTAMGMWGYRHAPGFISRTAGNIIGKRDPEQRSDDLSRTDEVCAEALRGFVADELLDIDWPRPDRLPPLLHYAQRRQQYLYREAVQYGDAPEQVMDVWRRQDLPGGPAPVLVFVPGGGWVHGRRTMQGYALLARLAELGWVCLAIDYRVSPQYHWPQHIADVKTAIAWARTHADEIGGDRRFVAIAGCSAGGHLAALAGLTHDDDQDLRNELHTEADTSVDAVVSIYGRYDWEDRSTNERELFMGFLESVVVRKRHEHHPELYRSASPIARVRADAPPFLVVHGSADSLIPVEQARAFVERLAAVSTSPVRYLELPGAGHGFDLIDRARTASTMTAIGMFLEQVERSHPARRAATVTHHG